jgi:hypothetical protein
MTAKEFIKELRDDVEAFAAYVEDFNKRNPKNQQEDLGGAEWFESFEIFTENRER